MCTFRRNRKEMSKFMQKIENEHVESKYTDRWLSNGLTEEKCSCPPRYVRP
jgi:hypothetical protein